MPSYSLHSKEVGNLIVAQASSVLTTPLSLKICKLGWLRSLPMAKDLSAWLNILFVRPRGWSGLKHVRSQTFELFYNYDIMFITQRADGEENDARMDDAMGSIGAMFANNQWFSQDYAVGGCSIVDAMPTDGDNENPLEEYFDTEEFRLMSGLVRVSVHAFEEAV